MENFGGKLDVSKFAAKADPLYGQLRLKAKISAQDGRTFSGDLKKKKHRQDCQMRMCWLARAEKSSERKSCTRERAQKTRSFSSKNAEREENFLLCLPEKKSTKEAKRNEASRQHKTCQ
jgi:hypothetical protein